jgi:hypothetical protein
VLVRSVAGEPRRWLRYAPHVGRDLPRALADTFSITTPLSLRIRCNRKYSLDTHPRQSASSRQRARSDPVVRPATAMARFAGHLPIYSGTRGALGRRIGGSPHWPTARPSGRSPVGPAACRPDPHSKDSSAGSPRALLDTPSYCPMASDGNLRKSKAPEGAQESQPKDSCPPEQWAAYFIPFVQLKRNQRSWHCVLKSCWRIRDRIRGALAIAIVDDALCARKTVRSNLTEGCWPV